MELLQFGVSGRYKSLHRHSSLTLGKISSVRFIASKSRFELDVLITNFISSSLDDERTAGTFAGEVTVRCYIVFSLAA